jgi:very-short-patch-repair endonuclease
MDSDMTNIARPLRRGLTPAEKILWPMLRGRRFAGWKFRRQEPLDRYVADFFCARCRLIVELDGETHLGDEAADQKRQKYLESQGFRLLRFWNTQVFEEREAVLEAIYQACVEQEAKFQMR